VWPPTPPSPPTHAQAVEATQFATLTKFHFLQNLSPQPTFDVFYRCESWGGGLVEATGSKLVMGRHK
jgi:hypothetical protein